MLQLNCASKMYLMFTLKALSPDNDGEIRKLISLYKSIYNQTYPINQVYDLRFWKSHIGTKLISIAVYDGKEIVAHFAIKNDPQSIFLRRLCLCAEKPLTSTEVKDLRAQLKDFLSEFCMRNGIRTLYSFTYANHWINSAINLREIGGIDCMLCPRYLPETHTKAFINSPEKGERISVLITALIPKGFNPGVSINNIKFHTEVSSKIFSDLGFSLNKSSKISSSFKGFSSYANGKMGVAHYYVKPSELSSEEQVLSEILSANSSLVFIDIEDVGVQDFTQKLDDRGFRMCGVSPLHGNFNSIVYFRDPKPELPRLEAFNSSQFTDLYKHIKNYKAFEKREDMLNLQHAI